MEGQIHLEGVEPTPAIKVVEIANDGNHCLEPHRILRDSFFFYNLGNWQTIWEKRKQLRMKVKDANVTFRTSPPPPLPFQKCPKKQCSSP